MAGEYAVKISIRNGLILRQMKKLGIKSQMELAKLSGLSPSIVGMLIGLKKRPPSADRAQAERERIVAHIHGGAVHLMCCD